MLGGAKGLPAASGPELLGRHQRGHQHGHRGRAARRRTAWCRPASRAPTSRSSRIRSTRPRPRTCWPRSARSRPSTTGSTPTSATRRSPSRCRPAGSRSASTSSCPATSGTPSTSCSARPSKGDQLSRSGWLADYPSMDNFLYPLYYSAQSGLNGYSFYNNPQVDKLLDQARGTAGRDAASADLCAGGEDHPRRRHHHPALLLPRLPRVELEPRGRPRDGPAAASQHVAAVDQVRLALT